MFSLSMDHDPDPLTHLPQAAAGAQHPHILNKDKQVDKLLKNASRPDISIEVNCNDENVNIHCNPGFFDLVARKTLLTISPKHQFTAGGITFELRSSTPQTDLSGVIQSTILKFVFIRDMMEYSATISVHNTTQNVQIQGSSSMPDGSKVPVFILNNYLGLLFKSSSIDQKDDITAFNNALQELAIKRVEQHQQQHQQPMQFPLNLCTVCHDDISKHNSKPAPCTNLPCQAKMHSKCFRKHSCPYKTKKISLAMTSFLAVDDSSLSIQSLTDNFSLQATASLFLIPKQLHPNSSHFLSPNLNSTLICSTTHLLNSNFYPKPRTQHHSKSNTLHIILHISLPPCNHHFSTLV